MYRVLHYIGGACYGGISAVVVNYYRNIDRNKIHFDIAVTDKYIGRNADILADMGAEIYPVCLKSENRELYTQQIEKILKEGKYDAIHVHGNDTSWYTLRIAKRCGIKRRIAHAHTAGHLGADTFRFRIRQTICQRLNCYYATDLISCGRKAGQFIYGNQILKNPKHTILPNAIDLSHFRYDKNVRGQKRRDIGVDGCFTVGFVGRMAPPKKPETAIEIFKAIKTAIPNAVMVMVGSGPQEKEIKELIESYGLTDSVKILGQRNDVADLYQAFDLYLLTSLYEGFPVAAVEAMATGLPCLLSDTITDELNFGSAIHYLPVRDTDQWAEKAKLYVKDNARESRVSEIKNAGLDISDTATMLEKIYLPEL